MRKLTHHLTGCAAVLACCALAFAGVMLAPVAAAANPIVVVDIDSGKVLFSEQANDPWYPASVTKLMTAYVALQAVHDGRVRMDSLLTVSPRSASLPPSKMGFKPGSQIRLDNALKIIMVKSANDVANTIAEGIGGSTDKFADLMNREAQRLGMSNTHFVNPHGLFDEHHTTSARDMAVLGRTLMLEFPDYAELFHIGAIQYGRRIMYNTNGLIGRYRGATGMKTGFICASGFNVVAAAQRGGRRLLLVVLGAGSASERTLLAASMFDKGFSSPGIFSPTLDSLPAASAATPPNLRSQICEKRGTLSEDEDGAITASNTNGNSDSSMASFFGSNALAYADQGAGKASLGPRAKAVPDLVWLGAVAPASREQAAADDAPKTKPMKGKGKVTIAISPKTPAGKAKATVTKASVTVTPAAPPARPKTPVVKAKAKVKQAAE